MKEEILLCNYYKAKVNYKVKNDVKYGCPNDGDIILVMSGWLQDEYDPYPNQWAFIPSRYLYWLPEEDIEIIESISSDEYEKERLMPLLILPNEKRPKLL